LLVDEGIGGDCWPSLARRWPATSRNTKGVYPIFVSVAAREETRKEDKPDRPQCTPRNKRSLPLGEICLGRYSTIAGSHSHPTGDSGLAHYLLYLALVLLAIWVTHRSLHIISSKEKRRHHVVGPDCYEKKKGKRRFMREVGSD
jgi:hypothetical protein